MPNKTPNIEAANDILRGLTAVMTYSAAGLAVMSNNGDMVADTVGTFIKMVNSARAELGFEAEEG